MLDFKRIKWVNFGSYGDRAFEMNFADAKVWAFTGKNGAGKSTIIDAISFALYGKPWRKIVKAKLVNNKNKRACRVEIEFVAPTGSYRVVRGIRPDIFEIYRDEVMINQDSKSRDFQSYLENDILGLSWDAMNQVMIIGKAKYVPFLQLTTEARRSFVEGVLQLEIFTAMRRIASQDSTGIEKDLAVASKDVDRLVQIIDQAVQSRENLLRIRQETSQQEIDSIKSSILGTEARLKALETSYDDIQPRIDARVSSVKSGLATTRAEFSNNLATAKKELDDFSEVVGAARAARDTAIAERATILSDQRNAKELLERLLGSKNCPTCGKPLDNASSDEHVDEARKRIVEIDNALTVVDARLVEVRDDLAVLETTQRSLQDVVAKERTILAQHDMISPSQDSEVVKMTAEASEVKSRLSQEARALGDLVERLGRQERNLKSLDEVIENSNKQIDEYTASLAASRESFSDMGRLQQAMNIVVGMLKDSGIKAVIMRRYISVINTIVNKLLADMGFFAVFELNETFEDKILTRGFEEMSYHSLSEGEKLRIDMAVLLAWRELCVLTGSSSTNLIVLDEILDASLDQEGLDAFMLALNENKDLNIVCITHHPTRFEHYIQRQLTFNKVDGYSVATIGDR